MDKLILYFQYPFVRYALIAGVLIALCAALLGVILVLKRFSFIGDGLSHAAFGFMAVAAVLNLANDMFIILPGTILLAVLLLSGGQKMKISGDAAIASVSAGALALGYMLMNVFSTSSNVAGDVCSSLFGSTSILTLSRGDVYLCIAVTAVTLLIFALFYRKIFAVTFDEDFAQASGVKVKLYNVIIAVVAAVIIVVGMKLAGSLLISALIIFPALAAMRVFNSFKSVIISSAVISVVCALLGIIVSIMAGTPTGATIVCMDVLTFFIATVIGIIFEK